MVSEAEPSFPPLQLTLVDKAEADNAVGSEIRMVSAAVQPLASVTVTE